MAVRSLPKGLIKPDVLATEETLGKALESRRGHSTALLEDVCPAPLLLGTIMSAGWAHRFEHPCSAVKIGHAQILTNHHRKRVRQLWGMQEYMSQCG